ncbi:uncharacterized protein LOC141898660 [Tubulanus polymorphus]|uniref:uncharacterized protein LOC141898660 n=1 Tax=Tubulanus polymorphus TaxID=672921 RepID=UPI003DA659F0
MIMDMKRSLWTSTVVLMAVLTLSVDGFYIQAGTISEIRQSRAFKRSSKAKEISHDVTHNNTGIIELKKMPQRKAIWTHLNMMVNRLKSAIRQMEGPESFDFTQDAIKKQTRVNRYNGADNGQTLINPNTEHSLRTLSNDHETTETNQFPTESKESVGQHRSSEAIENQGGQYQDG